MVFSGSSSSSSDPPLVRAKKSTNSTPQQQEEDETVLLVVVPATKQKNAEGSTSSTSAAGGDSLSSFALLLVTSTMTMTITEPTLRRTVWFVNGLSALLLLTGLWTIGAAQQIYDETYHYDFGGGPIVVNNNDDDLLAIESFHQRWMVLPVWFVPAQLVKVACALVGVFYGSRAKGSSTTTSGDDGRAVGIAWLAMAAMPFAFDFGLAVGLRRFDRAIFAFGGLLPHLLLIERQLRNRQRHRQQQRCHPQRQPPRNDTSPSQLLLPCHHQEQYWNEAV
jgi:hypothetical protein